MPYVRCSERLEDAAGLSLPVGSLKGFSSFSNQDVNIVLDWSYIIQPFPDNWGFREHDCNFQRQTLTAGLPVIAVWRNVDIFRAPLSSSGLVHALLAPWRSGYECRHELNIPSPPVRMYVCFLSNLDWDGPSKRRLENYCLAVLRFRSCVRVSECTWLSLFMKGNWSEDSQSRCSRLSRSVAKSRFSSCS